MSNYTPLQKLELMAGHYGTDKKAHGYLPHYAKHLPAKIQSILEIGCFQGASLKMWAAYYVECKPRIHVVDLFGDPANAPEEEMHKFGFITHKGDQADINFLYTIKEQFDVIIDDGSHNADHQQTTFKHLFVNNLRSGGIYIIEDLHCCNDPFYWNNHPWIQSASNTMLGALNQLERFWSISNGFFTPDDSMAICPMIRKVNFYDGKIAFFERK